jgi:hypothetical protein
MGGSPADLFLQEYLVDFNRLEMRSFNFEVIYENTIIANLCFFNGIRIW